MNIEKTNSQNDFEVRSPNSREFSEINEIAEHKNHDTEIIKPDIKYIEITSAKTLFEQNRSLELKTLDNSEHKGETDENKRGRLTEDEKTKVKEDHPDWPDEIVKNIGSWEEYAIYDNANLKVEYVNGKPCLIRSDIDIGQTDVKGRTNKERMEQGLSPLDKNNRPIELHHIGQKADSPLAELTFDEHHCDGNDTVLHDKTKETEVHGEGNNWQGERENHWETRSSQN